jgi:ABC-2 type transport system permease protein
MTAVTARPEVAAPGAPRAGQHSLAGTRTLIRFMLRRDRIKLPAWLLGITFFVFYYGAALPTIYPDDESLEAIKTFMEGPVGALLAGPGYGRDDPTIEGVIAGVYGLYFLLAAALMNILLVSRHTRVDEQTGRTELIRASVVGRYAPLTATLTVAVGANVLLALLIGGAMAGSGYGGDSNALLFGASIGAVGLVWAGIMAITVQVSEYSRAASGIAGAALGAAYLIRAAGDMIQDHGSPLSWFSPLAWSQQTRAYVDGRWWPLALSLVFAALAAAVGYVLSARRDLGAGLVAARRGQPQAPPWLGSPLSMAFRLQRASLLWWTFAVALGGLLYGWLTQPIVDAYEDMPAEMLDVFRAEQDQLLDAYLSVMALWWVLIVCVFVILGVQFLRTEETRGRAEPVLATAASRWAWFGSHLSVLAIGGLWLLFVAGITTGAGAAIGIGDAGYFWEVTVAHVVHTPVVLVLLGIAALLFGLLPRAIGVTWAVFGYSMIIGFFGPLMDLSQWAYNISPLEHIARAPLEGFTWQPVVILTVIAAALGYAGLVLFRRRDLETK